MRPDLQSVPQGGALYNVGEGEMEVERPSAQAQQPYTSWSGETKKGPHGAILETGTIHHPDGRTTQTTRQLSFPPQTAGASAMIKAQEDWKKGQTKRAQDLTQENKTLTREMGMIAGAQPDDMSEMMAKLTAVPKDFFKGPVTRAQMEQLHRFYYDTIQKNLDEIDSIQRATGGFWRRGPAQEYEGLYQQPGQAAPGAEAGGDDELSAVEQALINYAKRYGLDLENE
jgi:hypothetical protein